MRHMRQPDRGRGARQFFGDDAGGGKIEPGTAEFRRHVQAEIPHLPQLGKDGGRQVVGVVHFRVQVVELGHEELASLVGQGLLFIRLEMSRKVDVVAQLLVHDLAPLRRAAVLRR